MPFEFSRKQESVWEVQILNWLFLKTKIKLELRKPDGWITIKDDFNKK